MARDDLDAARQDCDLAVVTTGGPMGPDRMCDTAASFRTDATGRVEPAWVNHTGGDSLYAVAADPLIWEQHPERDRPRWRMWPLGPAFPGLWCRSCSVTNPVLARRPDAGYAR